MQLNMHKVAQLLITIPLLHDQALLMIKEFYMKLVSWIYVTINCLVLSPDKFIALRLRQKVQVNKTNFLFTFDLPKLTDQIGLLAGQYIAVK